ncbi:acetyltransferase [Aquiflexum sp.]|uniref:acetyltransferase n=1 Tax=Aquiflexum sp. TaxID=1872584 RepID=UPI00359478DE
MKKQNLYIIGASGHAKAIIDLLEDKSIIAGIYDDNPKIKEIMGIGVQCPASKINEVLGKVHIAIGDNRTRKKIFESLSPETKYHTIIHQSAIVSTFVKMGKGTAIMEGTIIKVDSVIGNHVIVNTASSIDHDCRISDFVHIGPGSNLCGNIKVGEGTLIGAGTVVIPGVSIGSWCVIGAGSVVLKDVPDGAKWMGNRIYI